jgi:predicted PurR-regulated permease PerM
VPEQDASIRDHFERLMPPGGRGRRMVGWGVVAWTGIGIGVLALALGVALGRVAGVVPYLVVASMVVFILNPAARALASRGVPRRLAAVLVFAAAVILGAVALGILVPATIHQTQDLVRSSPSLLRKGGGVVGRLSHSSNPLLRRAGDAATGWVDRHAGTVRGELNTFVGAGLGLAHAGLVLVLGGFLGFLLLLSLPGSVHGMRALIPPSLRGEVDPWLGQVQHLLGGYVRARLIVSGAVFVVATIGMWAVGMPFWLLLGFIVGVANLIPMFGAWIGAIPVVLVSLATKPPAFLFVVLAVIAVAHVVDGYILSPLVLKGTTQLHPIVVLLVVLVGADLFGFWGVLAAIPVAGVVQLALRTWVLPRITGLGAAPTPAAAPPAGA